MASGRWNRMKSQAGMTLLELLIAMVVIVILASVAMPLSRIGQKRIKEMELRQNLRELRDAIDQFKMDWDEKKISHSASDIANEETGYPKRLDVLVKGVPIGDPNQRKLRKYLRRIPKDPFTKSIEWGTRCYEDDPDALIACSKDVYDVHSQSSEVGLDGTKYQTW
jgi:general secretion pathway protein G